MLARMIWQPSDSTVAGIMPLIVACVPTAMKAGVSNEPCAVVTVPTRALDVVLLAAISNWSAGDDDIGEHNRHMALCRLVLQAWPCAKIT